MPFPKEVLGTYGPVPASWLGFGTIDKVHAITQELLDDQRRPHLSDSTPSPIRGLSAWPFGTP